MEGGPEFIGLQNEYKRMLRETSGAVQIYEKAVIELDQRHVNATGSPLSAERSRIMEALREHPDVKLYLSI